MFVTLINDCKSENDRGRLETRYATLFPNAHISFVGVNSDLGTGATLEAAGNLVDVLDASEEKSGVIAVNVAPRGQKEDGENGSSFCYFWYKNTIAVTTLKGYILSLVKKLKIIDTILVLDTERVLKYATSKKLISNTLSSYTRNSQFRSFDFQPRVALWLIEGEKIPAKRVSIDEIPNAPDSVWLIDSFGNVKTTILVDDIKIKTKDKVKTNFRTFRYYERLKDVPDRETAIYTGSSGIGDKRFLEIATQGKKGSAAKTLGLKVGKEVKFL